MLQRFQEHSCYRGFKTIHEWLQGSMHVSMLLPSHKRVLLVLSRHTGDSMQVGDLARCKHTGELYIITEIDNEDYVIVHDKFLMRKDQLEVLCK